MPLTPPAVALDAFALTVTGRVRRHNEDSLLCCPALGLWAVADGMGGHQRGEVASALAVQTLEEQVAQQVDLVEAVHAAHRAILAAAGQDSASQGMGTTLVAARFSGARYQVAWIGDSRAYLLSAAHIQPLTKDHSWVQAMIDAGELDEDQARSHPKKNVISQCLGQGAEPLDVGLVQGCLEPGQRLLLCSDGLTRELTDREIAQASASARSPQQLVSALIAAANAQGGHDNISCAVIAKSGPTGLGARARLLLNKVFKFRPSPDSTTATHD